MRLLALDTAGTRCSVALLLDDELRELDAPAERLQAEHVLPMVERLLAEAGLTLKALDAIAFGRGPGAFTGLRVATSVAQGLAYGAGVPVVPVSDLEALAAAAVRVHGVERVMACLDARMHEVYWAAYRARPEGLTAMTEEALSPPSDVVAPDAGPWFGAGPGWAAYGETLQSQLPALAGIDPVLVPTAGDVARLGRLALQRGAGLPPERALPVYLRDKVATPKA
ncbi:MAG TPA: tRNA (adenosine(37)-N6)-threonylcarbamoyltransferase complex dimerization subunit type 1 TsaB [Gammaproteobacteria bacterium]|nr:tRNA (adenosine(37)-N6)-threonylcarbamoyltransferase complex dimerization subunit type 1 TsaB [Gammaproteobacteria bacterium]